MMKLSRKILVLTAGLPLLFSGAWFVDSVVAQARRICVCHVENEKTGAGHVIVIDSDALEGHLRHGDSQCTVDCGDVRGKRCNVSSGGACTDSQNR
jgi:hypothetical protein